MSESYRVFIRLASGEADPPVVQMTLDASLPPDGVVRLLALLHGTGAWPRPGLVEASSPASAPQPRSYRRPRGQPPPGKIRFSSLGVKLGLTPSQVAGRRGRRRLAQALDPDGWLDEAEATRILVRTSRPGTKISKAARAHAARLGLDLGGEAA